MVSVVGVAWCCVAEWLALVWCGGLVGMLGGVVG